jgi:hypothetical protein
MLQAEGVDRQGVRPYPNPPLGELSKLLRFKNNLSERRKIRRQSAERLHSVERMRVGCYNLAVPRVASRKSRQQSARLPATREAFGAEQGF